jgi:hypothetical protein
MTWGRPPDRHPYRHPVGWGAWTETPPVVTAPVVHERPVDWLFTGLVRPAWAYRVELTLILALAALYYWLVGRVGKLADALVLGLAALVAGIPWTREHLARVLYCSHLRRRWALACRHAELATRNDRVPRITRCLLTRAGEQLRVRLPAGGQVPDLDSNSERICAFLGAREVRVTRAPENARYARVIVLRRDPLADPQPIPWPWLGRESCSLWHPIPVGLNEDGTEVTVSLPYRNLLLGGEPDAGKSSILQLLIAVGPWTRASS